MWFQQARLYFYYSRDKRFLFSNHGYDRIVYILHGNIYYIVEIKPDTISVTGCLGGGNACDTYLEHVLELDVSVVLLRVENESTRV